MKKYGIYLLSGLIFAHTMQGSDIELPFIGPWPKNAPLVLWPAATALAIASTVLFSKAIQNYKAADDLENNATEMHNEMLENLISILRMGQQKWLETHTDLAIHHQLIDVVIIKNTLNKLINGTSEFIKVTKLKKEAMSKLCAGFIYSSLGTATVIGGIFSAVMGTALFLNGGHPL